MIVFIALVLQAATISLTFYILHSYQETAAKEWSSMKSERDRAKNNCEDNAKTIDIFKVWSEQQELKPPPSLLVSKQCNGVEKQKTENK